MKKYLILALIIVGLFLLTLPTFAYVNVKGYYRSNGTYVQPYVRSSPNALKYDNYGYRPGGSSYNPSYYAPTRNYQPSWYVPSYNTDNNYYVGKNLYKFGR